MERARGCDLAVLGSGPGGYAAALTASRQGLRVCLIERAHLGGVCLNAGCIPTKALVAVAHTMRRIRQAQSLGIRVEGVRLDYDRVLARNARLVWRLRQGLMTLLRHSRIDLVPGTAVFEDAHTVRITDGEESLTVSAERFIVATGASPQPGPWGFDGKHLLSYRDLLALPSLPQSLLILGGGAIGCEFASCFASFGVPVTIIEPQPQALPAEDPEAVRVLVHSLEARGVTILTKTTVQALSTTADGVCATLSSGQTVKAQRCLIAIGQRPNSRDLGLEPLGIRTDAGVEVNEYFLTSQPHIAAIGDCLEGHGLAHLASHEGTLAVHNLIGHEPRALDLQRVPRCVYTDPELAQVGVTEPAAPDSARVSRFAFAALGKSLCDEESEGFVKLLVDAQTDRVLGATMVGASASSLIHLAVLAIHHGLTGKQLARTITAHPTLPEALSEAAAQIYGEALSTAAGARAPKCAHD